MYVTAEEVRSQVKTSLWNIKKHLIERRKKSPLPCDPLLGTLITSFWPAEAFWSMNFSHSNQDMTTPVNNIAISIHHITFP